MFTYINTVILIAYIYGYTLAYLSYLYNVGVPVERKPAPGDHEFNLNCQMSQRLILLV